MSFTSPYDLPWATSSVFRFEAHGSGGPPLEDAIVNGLGEAWDHPPSWASCPVPESVQFGLLRSPRSKVVGRLIKARRVGTLAEYVRKPRAEVITGAALRWAPGAEQDDFTVEKMWTTMSVGRDHPSGRERWELLGYVGDALADQGFAVSVVELAACALRCLSAVEWAAGWFGHFQVPPFVYGRSGFGSPDVIPGYNFVVCLSPAAQARLGGDGALAASPAAVRQDVVTVDGESWTILAATNAPAELDPSVLRRWREFLGPVLAPSAIDGRTAYWQRFGVGRYDPLRSLPPFMLSEDWDP